MQHHEPYREHQKQVPAEAREPDEQAADEHEREQPRDERGAAADEQRGAALLFDYGKHTVGRHVADEPCALVVVFALLLREAVEAVVGTCLDGE